MDRAVAAGEVDAAHLAPVLGAYREDAEGGPATGWYERDYLPWVRRVHARARRRAVLEGGPVPPTPPRSRRGRGRAGDLPEHAQAIRDALTAFPDEVVHGRRAARRLLAVTVAARSMPHHFGPEGSHAEDARAPLAFTHPDLDPGSFAARQNADRLHARLHNDFTAMHHWEGVVRNSVSEGLLPATFAVHAAAPPCTGKLILRKSGNSNDPEPCTVLEAEFTTDQITFEQAKRYLEPQNWQFPGSLWTLMKRGTSLGENSWVYHETVTTSFWTISTDLQFWFSCPVAGEARAEYDISPIATTKLPDVEIDEGSLRVIDLGKDGIRVVTTKRVRFPGSFDGAGLAMFMCATGYSTVLEDMVFSVATSPVTATQPFPVQAPTGGGVVPDQDPKKKTAASKQQSGAGAEDSLDAISADAAQYVGEYLNTMTTTYSASMASVQKGTYKVEDAWKDGISMWTTYMTGLGKAVELGTRAAKVYSQKKPDES